MDPLGQILGARSRCCCSAGSPSTSPSRRDQGSVTLSLYSRASTLYHKYMLTYSVPLFLKRQCDRTLGARAVRHEHAGGARASKKDACGVAEAGPTSAFYSCIPTGMCGPTCIFWATLTHSSLLGQRRLPERPDGPLAPPASSRHVRRGDDGGTSGQHFLNWIERSRCSPGGWPKNIPSASEW